MSSQKNRRGNERLEALLPVDYYTDRDKLHKFYLATNISSGGAFISTTTPFKIGDDLDVIVSLFNEADPDEAPRRFVIHGQVRHVQTSPVRGSGEIAGMGVQWLDLDTNTWEEMKGIIGFRMGAIPPEPERRVSFG
jgi:Tfp pilus assembly protein PilZ